MRSRRSVPSTGWYAVLALAIVAALGSGTVVGAGLSLWRGTAAQRAVSVPVQPLLHPGAGVVTVPAQTAHPRARAPKAPAPHVAPLTTRVLSVHQTQQPAHASNSPAGSVPKANAPTRVGVKPVTRPPAATHIGFGPLRVATQARLFEPTYWTPVSVVFFGRPPAAGVHLLVRPSSYVPAARVPQSVPSFAQEDASGDEQDCDEAEHDKAKHDKAEHEKPEHEKPEHENADSEDD